LVYQNEAPAWPSAATNSQELLKGVLVDNKLVSQIEFPVLGSNHPIFLKAVRTNEPVWVEQCTPAVLEKERF
jgi:hypothetical protein